MRKLGVIRDLSYKGSLIVKASYAPRIGERILDSKKRPLGRVSRVFGPVKAPYVMVEPLSDPEIGLLGSDVSVDVE